MWRSVLLLLVACKADDPPSQDPNDPVPTDADDDGFDVDEDCDDSLATVHPGAVEAPYDGLDNDCADGDLVDVDGDGVDALEANGDDCDDEDPDTHPSATEVPYDGIDQDCSGSDLVDVDGDGSGLDDCDDADAAIHPAAEEIWYDGVDQDCRADCDYDADRDDAVAAEWLDLVTDGSPCDQDPGPDAQALEDCDDDNPAASTQAIESITPPDGATDVDAMGTIEVRLRENEANAQLRLLDPDGLAVPTGGFTEAPDWHFMYPLQTLAGFTTYTVEVSHGCGVETTTFTTGVGFDPVDPNGLVGTTWDLNPNGIGGGGFTVLNYFGWSTLALVMVEATDGVNLDLLIAAPRANGSQDLCVPTGQISGADFSGNPLFVSDRFDYPLSFLDGMNVVTFVQQQGTIEAGIFAGDLIDVTVTGLVESHEVALAAGIGLNQICNQFACVACPDGSGATCAEQTLWLSSGSQSSEVIVPRSAAEIALDPACP